MKRVYAALLTLALMMTASPAHAQMGRVLGTVTDPSGKPVKGATIRTVDQDRALSELSSTTDSKGRFGMVGLRSGAWTFVVEAPGYETTTGTVQVRTVSGPPVRFVMKIVEGIPGALSKDIGDQVNAANTLREQGRYEQAITAYQAIQSKNARMTALSVVLADTYREQAEREQSPSAKQTLYDRAIQSYSDAMKNDDVSDRARLDLGLTQVAAGRVDDGVQTLQGLVASTPQSAAAKEAAAKLAELRR